MPIPIIERLHGACIPELREELKDLMGSVGDRPRPSPEQLFRHSWNEHRKSSAADLQRYRQQLERKWDRTKSGTTFDRLAVITALVAYRELAGTPPEWEEFIQTRPSRKYERRLRAVLQVLQNDEFQEAGTTGICEEASRATNCKADRLRQHLKEKFAANQGFDSYLDEAALRRLAKKEAKNWDLEVRKVRDPDLT